MISEADPYVFLKCEGVTKKSEPIKNSISPVWNYSVLFYRRKPDKPIKIQEI